MLTRKEKLLFFCIGRETTPYEAAERWERQKGTEINLGPWYACKSELQDEELIGETAQRGRQKLIRANVSAYLSRLDENIRGATDPSLFEKHAPRIVDFIIKCPESIPDEGSPYYPVLLFLAARLMIGKNHLQNIISAFSESLRTFWGVTPKMPQTDAILGSVRTFIQTLSRDELKELHLKRSEERKILKYFYALVQLAPASLAKQILVPMLKVGMNNDKQN